LKTQTLLARKRYGVFSFRTTRLRDEYARENEAADALSSSWSSFLNLFCDKTVAVAPDETKRCTRSASAENERVRGRLKIGLNAVARRPPRKFSVTSYKGTLFATREIDRSQYARYPLPPVVRTPRTPRHKSKRAYAVPRPRPSATPKYRPRIWRRQIFKSEPYYPFSK